MCVQYFEMTIINYIWNITYEIGKNRLNWNNSIKKLKTNKIIGKCNISY
jgi:hypothetical protein